MSAWVDDVGEEPRSEQVQADRLLSLIEEFLPMIHSASEPERENAHKAA